MKKKKLVLICEIILLIPLLFLLKDINFQTLAQQAASVKSTFVTKVGAPTGPAPITTLPGTTPIADASCPIPQGKIICASFGKVEPWGGFDGICRSDTTGNGGHCSQIYINNVGICIPPTQGGNLIRTAKSIDVVGPGTKAGDPVYLPTINGETIKWRHTNVVSADPPGKTDFGWIKIFQSVGASQGVWTMHMVHVNSVGPIGLGETADSGKNVATLYAMSGPHVHVTIGLNIKEPVTDGNLQLYDPNWKFPDRELGMCTK